MEKFGTNFIRGTAQDDGQILKNVKLVGLYFGAKWSEPCQRFNATLKEFYKEVNKDEKCFEIIYFGFDQKNSHFLEVFSQMPWLAYEFKDPKKILMYLEYKQFIQGIPCLLVINIHDGKVITKNGRGNIEKEGTDALEKWLTQQIMKQ